MTPLTSIKLLHTAIWAFFAAAILALPWLGLTQRFPWALAVGLFVALETAVLAANRGHCPLTAVAARHTPDRAPNFDIYLTRWLAQHNKTIFGSLLSQASCLSCGAGGRPSGS